MARKQRANGTLGGVEIPDSPTIGDLKRYLVRLIQAVHRGRVSVRKANCLGQLANILVNTIVDHELEERISRLELEREAGRLTTGPRQLAPRQEGSA